MAVHVARASGWTNHGEAGYVHLMGHGVRNASRVVGRWTISAGALVLVLSPLEAAHAQAAGGEPNPTVIELYTEAWAARNEGRWDEACAKFQAALAIEATPAI